MPTVCSAVRFQPAASHLHTYFFLHGCFVNVTSAVDSSTVAGQPFFAREPAIDSEGIITTYEVNSFLMYLHAMVHYGNLRSVIQCDYEIPSGVSQ